MLNRLLPLLTTALILASLAAMPGQAAGTTVGGGGSAPNGCGIYVHQSVLGVAAVINTGDNEYASSLMGCGIARSNTQILDYTATYSGPAVLALAGGVYTWLVGDTLVGCTISGFTTHADQLAAATGATTYARITMTSNECHGALEFKMTITVAAVIVYQWDVFDAINIRVEQTTFNQVNSGSLANYDYLCRATGITFNAFNPATTVCQEALINGNHFNYLCAATGAVPNSFNPATTTCNTPTINVAQSGTWTLAGGLTITDDANGWSQVLSGTVGLTGTVSIAQSGAWTMTNNLAGGLTITDDANGWAIHQDPITGSITVDLADDTTNDGALTIKGNIDTNTTVVIGNATANTTIANTITVRNPTGEFFAPILLWLTALIIMLRSRKLLAAAVCSLGVVIAAFSLPFTIHAIAIGALLVALWLEATGRERIIQQWFSPGTDSTRRG